MKYFKMCTWFSKLYVVPCISNHYIKIKIKDIFWNAWPQRTILFQHLFSHQFSLMISICFLTVLTCDIICFLISSHLGYHLFSHQFSLVISLVFSSVLTCDITCFLICSLLCRKYIIHNNNNIIYNIR